MPKIHVYAEILTHIRQLTIYASTGSQKQLGTKLRLATNEEVVIIVHEGQQQSIRLPTQIAGKARTVCSTFETAELSVRLDIDEKDQWRNEIATQVQAPWSSSVLGRTTSIQCRACRAQVLKSYQVGVWKEMPNENWAELMELWFCHKPHDEHAPAEDEAAAAKGFSSRSRLVATPGVGMTDLVSFVLHQTDCSNIKVAETQTKPTLTMLRCARCDSILGSINEAEELVRLKKSAVAVRNSEHHVEEQSFTPSIFICAQLLSLIESTSIRRVVCYCSSTTVDVDSIEAQPLVLWIFNPDIYFSCPTTDKPEAQDDIHPQTSDVSLVGTNASANGKLDIITPSSNPGDGGEPFRRGAKVFYRRLSDLTTLSADEFLDQNTAAYEALPLLDPADLAALGTTLKSSNQLLPASARRFQDWDVGLLERWEETMDNKGARQL